MNILALPLTIFNQQGQRELLEFQTQGKQIFFFQLVYQKKFFCQFFKIPINYNQILKN